MGMKTFQAQIMTAEGIIDGARMQKGIQQRDAISTFLNIALDGVICAADLGRAIVKSSIQIVAYTDDIVVIVKDKRNLEGAI